MKLRDFRDYFTLRRMTANPWEIIRFRKAQRSGRTLEVRMVDGPPLFIRGGLHDFHFFSRIYLRDEYRLSGYSDWECVVDLGANVGLFSARASTISQRVIAYEPVPMNFEQLRLSTRFCRNVVAVKTAVAGKAGLLRIYRPRKPNRTGAHSACFDLDGQMSETYDEVHAITLDELFRRHEIKHCDLLKLDVEGKEYEVLCEASDEVFRRIRRIHGEYHSVTPRDPRAQIDHLTEFLRSKGYTTEIVSNRKRPNFGLFFATQLGLARGGA